MAEHDIPAHGAFCWNELATTDAEAAKSFYAGLFGWTFKEGDVAGANYNEIIVDGKPVGGIHQMDEGWGENPPPPHWMAYVAVADADATAKRVEELGGKVCCPPTDIPKVGRFAIITDPAGATISIIALAGAHD
jgi:predicted enzyme related to lactoylglutathione lyase